MQTDKEEGFTGRSLYRDDLLKQWVADLDASKHWTWLDIGAGRGQVSRELIAPLLPKHVYKGYDTQPRHPEVLPFDGKNIPETSKVDFVLFNFVLHHAAGNLTALLKSALSLTGTLVIQEDVGDGTPETWAKLMEHDRNGVFLSIEGWVELFRRLSPGCQVLTLPHPGPALDIPWYHVPRCLFVVRAKAF